MARPTLRRVPRLESLERREVLSGPSANAQYMLELINQARTNPAAAADRVTQNLDSDTLSTLGFYNVNVASEKAAIAASAPRQPLAWSDQLGAAAQAHSQDMANNNFESHTGSDGSTVLDRLDRAGYTNRIKAAENAYAYAASVDNAMQAFLLDWGNPDRGHRRTLLEPDSKTSSDQFSEVGIGMVDAGKLGIGPTVVTQDFGRRADVHAQLLGVVYDDKNGDRFYAPGEGRGGAEIDATNESTGQTTVTNSMDAGGYQVPLDPGTYRVTAKVAGQVYGSREVSIGNDNVKVDFILGAPIPAPPPVVVTPPPAPVTPPPAPAPPPPPAPVTPPPAAPTAQAPTVVIPTIQAASSQSSIDSALKNFDLNWVQSWTGWSAKAGK
jgi:uncharacterized protein YkwD